MFISEMRVSRAVVSVVFLFTILSMATVASGQSGASFQGLGNLPISSGPTIEAFDVSADGSHVVGQADSNTPSGVVAFRRQPSGVLDNLGHLNVGGKNSKALAVSSDGSFVVGVDNFMSSSEAFIWSQADGLLGLGNLPGGGAVMSRALGVSADGSIVVGQASSSSGLQAFRWAKMVGMTGLGDLPGGIFESNATCISADGSVIVGIGNSISGEEAFRWTAMGGMAGLGDLPGGVFQSRAFGVSADGLVVVGSAIGALGQEAFRWTQAGGMVGLGDLPGGAFQSVAMDASASGTIIVGEGINALGENAAFIWDPIHGMRDFQEVLVNDFGLDLTGWRLEIAHAVSDDGLTIVGRGRFAPTGQTTAWMATMPIEITCSATPTSKESDDKSKKKIDDSQDGYGHEGLLAIRFDVSGDNSGLDVTAVIDIGIDCHPMIPLVNGERIRVKRKDKCKVEVDDGHLKIEGPMVNLVVTAVGSAGHASTCETDLIAAADEDDDKGHSRDVENGFTPPFIVEVVGQGRVGFDPERSAYNFDEVIVLNAIPEAGWRFDHWEGSIGGNRNPHALAVGEVSDKVMAVFTKVSTSDSTGICGVGVAMPVGILMVVGLMGWRRRRRD